MPPQSDDVSASMLIGLRITSWYHDRTAREVARAGRGAQASRIFARARGLGSPQREAVFGRWTSPPRGETESGSRRSITPFVGIARKMKRFNPARFEPRL